MATRKSVHGKHAVVPGGTLIVVGDTHLSPKYVGSHRDYIASGFKVLEKIREHVLEYKADGKVSLMILGDVFGVNETNMKDEWYLLQLNRWFVQMNHLTENRVFAVRGNHDMGEYTTFDYAEDMGWIKNPDDIDYTDSSGKNVYARFHILNYGHESRKLRDEVGIYNIVFGHNDYQIAGLTNWYQNEASKWNGNHVAVKEMKNVENVSQIVSGHIHTPSTDPNIFESMPDGHTINVFYPGSPARVAERVSDVWYLTYAPEADDANLQLHKFGLWGIEEEFNPRAKSDEQIMKEKDKAEKVARLNEALEMLMSTHTLERLDIRTQIDKIPGFSEEQRKIAKEYYEKAENGDFS